MEDPRGCGEASRQTVQVVRKPFPGIIPGHILAGSPAVRVLGCDIKWSLIAVEPRYGQMLLRCFLGTALLCCILTNGLALGLARFVVKPRNTPHPFVLVQGGKGTAFLHHPALDQGVSNCVVGVCKELRAFVQVIVFQTFQHGENAVLFVVQEPFRVIIVQSLPQKNSTRATAQNDVFAYLETFYNTVRPHSALGWISPTRFEAKLCASAA